MDELYWELSTLSRAIAYRNLSIAAANIGLSQPQLSRIVSKIEAQLKIVLLDRSSRRKSGWTPVAYKLAEHYSKSSKKFKKDIERILGSTKTEKLRIGALEGLIPLALSFCNALFKAEIVKQAELDVHDLNKLEEYFFKGEYDLVFVSREPVGKKLKYSMTLGYQRLKKVQNQNDTLVISSFEFQTHNKLMDDARFRKMLVSNSLSARQGWINEYGGTGVLPSAVYRTGASFSAIQDEKSVPVILIGSDILPPDLWENITDLKFLFHKAKEY